MKPPLLAALLVAGCAEMSLAPPLTSPKSGGAPWFEASQRGELVAAVKAQERAYALAQEWGNSSEYKQRLERYQQALAKPSPSPDEPRASPVAAP